jgi:hypothetical protein
MLIYGNSGALTSTYPAGYYPEGWPESKHKKSWQKAQLDHVDAVLEFAGVSKADRVSINAQELKYCAGPGLQKRWLDSCMLTTVSC